MDMSYSVDLSPSIQYTDLSGSIPISGVRVNSWSIPIEPISGSITCFQFNVVCTELDFRVGEPISILVSAGRFTVTDLRDHVHDITCRFKLCDTDCTRVYSELVQYSQYVQYSVSTIRVPSTRVNRFFVDLEV